MLDWYGVSHTDAAASLLPVAMGTQAELTQRACAVSESERAIRTPSWFLRAAGTGLDSAQGAGTQLTTVQPEPSELFVKPDDRWDVNNVADRCPDIVAQMQEQLASFQQAAISGAEDQLAPLPSCLNHVFHE
jgi:hypothetical protein